MSQDVVILEQHGGHVELVLNRPWHRNAITPALVERCIQLVSGVAADRSVGAVILRGAGGTFCSGMDLQELATMPAGTSAHRFEARWADLHMALAALPIPLIGALEHAAVASGAALALACDLLVVGHSSFLHVSEVALSSTAPVNVAWLTYKHGPAFALEAVIAAPRYDATMLKAKGIAHEVVDDDRVIDAARELADRLARHDRETVVALKRSIRAAAHVSFDQTLTRVTTTRTET